MDDENLKQYSTWYIALIAVGAVISASSAAVSNNIALLVGLALVLVGVGEFMNHPFRQAVHFDSFGRPTGTISGRRREPKIVGIIFDFVGVLVGVVGLFRILQA